MSETGYINNWYGMSDAAILKQLALFIKQMRLKKNLRQVELAEKAGIHRVTLSEFENGDRSISLLTFIELLRGLNELELLEVFKVQQTISPLEMAKLEAKNRERASVPKLKIAAEKRTASYKKKTRK
jgi:transcriptional regulator with XRE-family HTH domain